MNQLVASNDRNHVADRNNLTKSACFENRLPGPFLACEAARNTHLPALQR